MLVYKKDNNLQTALKISILVVLIIIGIMLFCPSAFADAFIDNSVTNTISDSDAQKTAKPMLDGVVRVITTLCTVVGIILGIVGFVKFIIAHANEQGPDQQKAIMWIAVAIILVIVPNVISAIVGDWNKLIKVNP